MYAIILINLFFKMKNGQDILSYLLFYATMFSRLSTELKDLSRLFMHYNKFQAATNQVEKILMNYLQEAGLEEWIEKLIINLIQKYLKDKIVVIVTHRNEIRKICNKHYEFNNKR